MTFTPTQCFLVLPQILRQILLGIWHQHIFWFFTFILNTCKILLLENKIIPLSSKETRFKNKDKIRSQFTNRFDIYQMFSKTTGRAWRAFKSTQRSPQRRALLPARIRRAAQLLCTLGKEPGDPKLNNKRERISIYWFIIHIN